MQLQKLKVKCELELFNILTQWDSTNFHLQEIFERPKSEGIVKDTGPLSYQVEVSECFFLLVIGPLLNSTR